MGRSPPARPTSASIGSTPLDGRVGPPTEGTRATEPVESRNAPLRGISVSTPSGRQTRPASPLPSPIGPRRLLPESLHPVLLSATAEIRDLKQNIQQVERQLETLSQSLPAVFGILVVFGGPEDGPGDASPIERDLLVEG